MLQLALYCVLALTLLAMPSSAELSLPELACVRTVNGLETVAEFEP